jgi:diacylglycerol kinase family enzyme
VDWDSGPIDDLGEDLKAAVEELAPRYGVKTVALGLDESRDLAATAVQDGADALGMARGDGSQAAVAAVAAEHDLPYLCVPAGTRNHFALDLGIDRHDVVGALDAFVDGSERSIDLGRVNGRVFVNDVAMGFTARSCSHPCIGSTGGHGDRDAPRADRTRFRAVRSPVHRARWP